ncbi:MAG: FAD-dependent oxidoreductase [Verrucomicrobia bacterium]|nr:FAD-dependent oxidoreductase [Verrucomicrobiota bacterium]
MKKLFRSFVLKLTCLSAPFTCLQGEPTPVEATVEAKVYPVVIIGGGVGALTSALYLARAGIEPIVIEGANPGGMITQSHMVGNWPGELEITGTELADKIRSQAEANGVRFRSEEVISVDFSKRPFTFTTRLVDDPEETRQFQAEACIIAMGTQSNYLGIAGESEYWGRGVSNCATCDGSLYRDKIVGIAGGGDSAVLEGLYLSNIAKEVHIFVRKGSFRALEEKRLETLLNRPNVKIIYNTTVESIHGNREKITHVKLATEGKKPYDFPLDGLFLAIGSRPNSALFKEQLKLDSKGYIELAKDQQTSIEGVYAIGDIVDPVYKQAITAAGDGSKAAMQAQKYISDRAVGLIAKAPRKARKLEPKIYSTGEVVEIYSLEQFEQELQSSRGPIVVDFYATWCSPCKKLSPMFEHSAGALSGKIKFLKVNVDKLHLLSTTYQVTAMPTVLVFDSQGSILERKEGTNDITDYLKSLERAE